MSIEEIIQSWRRSRATSRCITDVRVFKKKEGKYSPFPEFLHPSLKKAIEEAGIERLYSHQAEAMRAIHHGENVVIVTPTASGKTLCYNLPVLHSKLTVPGSKALYLFPTKALSQDQMVELQGLIRRTGESAATFTYDGDTPHEARAAIRSQGDIVITNPDMLHTAILPHHTKWLSFFQNLRFVVIDELHSYRGIFGSHMANVLRRLDRVCRFYGSAPQFICCSATIANPKDLAEKLLEREVTLIDQSGSPSSEKSVHLLQPAAGQQGAGDPGEPYPRSQTLSFPLH